MPERNTVAVLEEDSSLAYTSPVRPGIQCSRGRSKAVRARKAILTRCSGVRHIYSRPSLASIQNDGLFVTRLRTCVGATCSSSNCKAPPMTSSTL